MRTSQRFLAPLLALCGMVMLASLALADVMLLKDGQTVTGRFQGADQSTVSFLVSGQTRKYAITEINSITFTASPAESGSDASRPTLQRRADPAPASSGTLTPSSTADTAGSSRTSSTTSPGSSTASRTPEPAKRMNVSIHAGTVVTVRMIDPVDSATDNMGQTYRASLDEPLMVDGETVVPRNADVTVKLVSVEQAGRIQGRSEVSLVIMDITVQGRKREVTTSEVTESGSSRGKQTATRAGVGAALGAAIGAIAGGGKGAAIGAAAGAGAGTAVQIATHGEAVKVPSETRLEFTLAQPLNL